MFNWTLLSPPPLSLSGLPGEAGDVDSVCADLYHLGLPTGFSGGGAKIYIKFLDLLEN